VKVKGVIAEDRDISDNIYEGKISTRKYYYDPWKNEKLTISSIFWLPLL